MPELPEVESVRLQLEPALVGRRFERVRVEDSRLVRPYDPAEVAAELEGERVAAVERRGKYLVVRFESGRVLLIHLRMTGNLLHGARGSFQDLSHRRAVVTLDDGSDVAYRDVRRFGTWLLLEPGEAEPYVDARVGDEPLDALFTAARLGERLAGRRTSLKAALLDQRTLAGMGNIYADEALWRARLNPLRPAAGLDRTELRRLHRGIRAALEHGLARQGSTLRDYRLPDGSGGSMQDEFRVYGRRDEPCERCGTLIVRTQVAGRTTWYCPTCQPERPAQAARSSSRRPSRSSRQSSV
jgi:formamidopyrimidine-DNA glycosylase